ncbi:MAG TPA: hypothetical protein EYM48_03275 [Campylobacterales bacterium]|nr:hypothetical protein [Campylobacterales bacterium]
MKRTLLVFIILLTAASVHAESIFSKTYEGCAPTKKEALYRLSGNILSRISTSDEQVIVVKNNDSVESKISSYSKATTNLSLVNIEYVKKENEVCAVVHKDDQTKYTKKLLKRALLYSVKNLPTDIDSKIQKLSIWNEDIKQLSFLLPAFLEDTDKEQKILNTKEKAFTDLYTESIVYSEALFFKSCKSTQEDARKALNKKLFSTTKKEESKGFFSSISSLISSDNTSDVLSIFDEQLISFKKDGNECVMLKKEELLNISKNMYADMQRVSENFLSKDAKKRYKEIDSLYEQLDVTNILLKLYPNYYKTNSFKELNDTKKRLSDIRKRTYPQFVLFNLSGAENISISLDNKPILNNEPQYIKNGNHTYKITAKGKCTLIASFDSDLFEDIAISKDLEGQSYPTVVFVTDKEPSIIVNGKVVKANITASINKCKDESRYVVKFAGQSISGRIDTNPGEANIIELNFLTSKELAVFNDAKTQKYSTISETAFSESLTIIHSDNFELSVTREPLHGELKLHASGSFEYISEKGFLGVDNFQYEIKTSQKTSAPKLVSINVLQSPIAKVETVASVQVKAKAVEKKMSVSYEDFKMYVESKELTAGFLQKVQKRFPEHFERLRKEMTN